MANKKEIVKSFGVNFSSGAATQIFVMGCNFFSIPFLLERFGIEAYGLVALYASLQAIFAILDGGISPLLIRQTAANVGANDKTLRVYSALLQTCRVLFLIMAFIGGTAIYLSSSYLSVSWLSFNELNIEQVVFVIQIMSIIVGLRWMSGFYRAVFVGNQNIAQLSLINIFIAVLRFLLVLLYLEWVDGTIVEFFEYQLLCGLIELILLSLVNSKVNKYQNYKTTVNEKFAAIKFNYKFALYAGMGSVIWIILTQVDKALISKLFELSKFSTFSLGVLGASVFFFLSSPLSNAIIPKLTEIHIKNDVKKFRDFYDVCLTLCAITLIPVVITVYTFALELMFLWTDNLEVSENAYRILGLYSLGNGVSVLGSFAYFLQSSKGNLQLHLVGVIGFLILFLPTLFILVDIFGVDGAGIAWLSVNLAALLFWCTYLHQVYLKDFFIGWLSKVFFPVVVFSFCLSHVEYLMYSLAPSNAFLISTLLISLILNFGLLYLYVYGFRKSPLLILAS